MDFLAQPLSAGISEIIQKRIEKGSRFMVDRGLLLHDHERLNLFYCAGACNFDEFRSPKCKEGSTEVQPLVQRTLADHQQLHGLLDGLQQNDIEALNRFGKCLTAHVRIEERELFPAIENLL